MFRWVAVLVALSVPRITAASPTEIFGFGSRHSARAGAASASANDFAAGYYNPAGLAFSRGKQLTFGVLGMASNLRANDERHPLGEPMGAVIGASAPAPLGGPLADRVFVSIGLFILPGSVVRIVAHFPDEPFFPYYDNRPERLVVLPTVAVRVHDKVAVGATVNFLGTLRGQVSAADGPTRGLDARVDEEVPPVARLNAGVRVRATDALDLAFTFRQRFEVHFETYARTTVAGQPINLDIGAYSLFSPTQLVLGAAWRHGPGLLSLDLAWADWSAYPGPFVQVTSQLPLLDPFAGQLPDVPYRDTFAARAGAELDLGAWALRGGYAFESSPIPAEQHGVTNLLDGPKHTVALGAGWLWLRAGGKKYVRVDLHAQAQLVGAREMDKEIVAGDDDYEPFDGLRDEDDSTDGVQISNPGYPTIESGGQVYSGGFTVELGF